MKGIYIYSSNDKDYLANGEAKKVLSQVRAFREAGVDIKLLDVVLDKKIDKIIYRLPFCGVYPRSFIRQCEAEAVDSQFVFIRKNIFDGTYYRLLKTIKKANPSIKIVVEIPTFPYFQEWRRLIDKPLIWKEKKVIPKVKKEQLVDFYLTLTDDLEIYGIPTIKFDNCIVVDDYSKKKNLQNAEEIHLIGVALLAAWHGYDRVVTGMRDYYSVNADNGEKVFFHIVGEGPEYKNLKNLVEQYNLDKYVSFEGKQKGETLDHLYDISDVGIGPLGLYRKGLQSAKSLKLREYCAKGLPFIKGGGDTLFDEYAYCLSVSNDDEPIDISKIVEWARTIDYEKAAESMREYAVHNFDWRRYIDSILKDIEG